MSAFRIFQAVLLAAICFTLATCSGATTAPVEDAVVDGGATTPATGPPAFASIERDPSQWIGRDFRGCDFLQDYAVDRVDYGDSLTAVFTPDWDPAAPDPAGLAYGIFQLESPEDGAALLEFDFARTGDLADLWIGLGEPESGCWEWYSLAGTVQFDCEYNQYLATTGYLLELDFDRYDDGGVMSAIMVFTGRDTWQFSVARPVTPIPVTSIGMDSLPLAGLTGDTLIPDLYVIGTPPLTYDWRFPAGLSPADSTDQYPEVALDEPGVYTVSVTVGNPYGDPLTREFELTVTNGTENWATLASAEDYSLDALAIAPGPAGGSLVTGFSENSEQRNPLLLEQDSAGNVVRARHWVSQTDQLGVDVISSPAGGYYLLTHTGMTAGLSWARDPGDVLIRLDAAGDVVWARQWDGQDGSNGYRLAAAPWGAVYVIGSYTPTLGTWNAQVLKVSDDGFLMWSRGYGLDSGELCFLSGDVNPAGSLVCGGERDSCREEARVVVASLNPQGDVEWLHQLPAEPGRDCVDLVTGPAGEIYVSSTLQWNWYGGISRLDAAGDYLTGMSWAGGRAVASRMEVTDGGLAICGQCSYSELYAEYYMVLGMVATDLTSCTLDSWGTGDSGQSARGFFFDGAGDWRLAGQSRGTIGLRRDTGFATVLSDGECDPLGVTVSDLDTTLEEITVEFTELEPGSRGIPRLLTMSLSVD